MKLDISREKTGDIWFLSRSVIVIAGGGLVFGYDIGIISTTLLSIRSEFSVTSQQEGWFVGITGAGGIIGCLIAGPLCDRFGRWPLVLLQNVLFCLGALITASATSLLYLVAGRFLVGIASVISAIAGIPYLTEIIPAEWRGFLICTYEVMVVIGVLLSFYVGYAFVSTSIEFGWRYAYAIPAAISVLQTTLLFTLPESPQWLADNGRIIELQKALQSKYGISAFTNMWNEMEVYYGASAPCRSPRARPPQCSENVALGTIPDDVTLLYNLLHNDTSGESPLHAHTDNLTSCSSTFRQLDANNRSVNPSLAVSPTLPHSSHSKTFKQKHWLDIPTLHEYAQPIAIISLIQALGQLGGGVVVRNYAATIFQTNGVSDTEALYYTMLLGLLKLLATFLVLFYIDRVGRRLLLLLGIALVAAGTALLAAFSDMVSILLGTAITIVGYSIGYGPIPWALSSEMFPVSIRGVVMAISLLSQNIFLFLTNTAYPSMLAAFPMVGTFGIFVFFNLVCYVMVYLYLPETRGREPETILLLCHRYRNAAIAANCMCRRKHVEDTRSRAGVEAGVMWEHEIISGSEHSQCHKSSNPVAL